MVKEASSVSERLKQAGIEVFDANNNLYDTTIVIKKIGEKWNDWSRVQQQAIANDFARVANGNRDI